MIVASLPSSTRAQKGGSQSEAEAARMPAGETGRGRLIGGAAAAHLQ